MRTFSQPVRRWAGVMLTVASWLFVMQSVQGQMIAGNAFLKGNYVEVGIAPYGTWGTTVDAPAGYHPRSNMTGDGPNYRKLAFVADPDKDGWTTGTPNKFYGDYFLGIKAWAGWGITMNGINYFSERSEDGGPGYYQPIDAGLILRVTNDGKKAQAVWETSLNGMVIRKVITVPIDGAYFTLRTEFINKGSAAVNDLYYAEYVNPDIDVAYNDVTGDPGPLSPLSNTFNSIDFQPTTGHKALVSARGIYSGAYLGIGSKDCRARVSLGPDGQYSVGNTVNALKLYEGGGGLSFRGRDAVAKNNFIAMAYKVGKLGAGDSTAMTIAYILSEPELDVALEETDPVFVHNGIVYGSQDTILSCPGDLVPVTLSNGDGISWSWSPASGLDNVAGTHVNITTAGDPVTYTITAMSTCGPKSRTITVAPDVPAAPGVITPLDLCQNSAAPPLSALGLNLNWYTGPMNGQASPVAPIPPTSAPGTTYWYVSQRSATGCLSNKARIAVNVHAPDHTGETVTVCNASQLPYIWNGISVPAGGQGVAVYSTVNQYGCDSTVTLDLVVGGKVFAAVRVEPVNPVICGGTPVTFRATGTNGGSDPVFEWRKNGVPVSIGDTYTEEAPSNGDRISCVLTSNALCVVNRSVEASASTVTISGNYDLPSAFSPNGDGNNDCFGLQQRAGVASIELTVYDRRGHRVFYSKSPQVCWDGTFNGSAQPAGTYVYFVKGEALCGKFEQKGTVVLVR